jgi:hypothetical protein
MQIRKLQSGHERWLQTPDDAVIYTGEDGARGSAPVSRRWSWGTIVRETKTGGTSGGRVAPAGGGLWARGTVEEVAAGGHQRARRRRARTGTAVSDRAAANRDSLLPCLLFPFFTSFTWAVVFRRSSFLKWAIFVRSRQSWTSSSLGRLRGLLHYGFFSSNNANGTFYRKWESLLLNESCSFDTQRTLMVVIRNIVSVQLISRSPLRPI